MSIRQCINDNHLEVHRNVAPHLQKAVYRIRLEVHNLRAEEDGERDGKSENHVTFTMLLGNGESVRVDMAPNPTTHLGKMDVRYRDDIVSRKTLRLTYVNARGCEKYFDPDQSPTADERYPPSSVDQILSFLVASNMHRYRFLYIDAQPLGCRYWIKFVLRALLGQGYLRHDVDLAAGIDGGQPPDHLLQCQWDTRSDRGIPAQIFPGIFLGTRPASSLTREGIQGKLQTATSGSLIQLAKALDVRNEVPEGEDELSTRYTKFCSWVATAARDPNQRATINGQRLYYVAKFAQLASLEGFEGMAADDLAMAATDQGAGFLFDGLHACLENKYSAARRSLVAARRSPRSEERFVYSLIAVCDMAGSED